MSTSTRKVHTIGSICKKIFKLPADRKWSRKSLPEPSFIFILLYRISLAPLIRHSRIHTGLLSRSVLEEFLRYSREQRIGQYILILLLPLRAIFLELRKLRSDQVCRTAGDRCLVADDLLLNFCIERFYRLAKLAHKDLLGLFCYHLVTLAADHV